MSTHAPRTTGTVAAPPVVRRCALCSYTYAHASLERREGKLHSHYMRWHYLDHRRELEAGGIL